CYEARGYSLCPTTRRTRERGVYPALRESAGNAVMTLRSIRTEHGLEGSELGALLGDRSALDHLFSVTYEELRRLASSFRRSDPNASLSPTTLVNEAWLKLRNSPRLAGVPRLHFKRIAARAMRQVLIEAARRRKAHKRGGGGLTIVTLGEAVDQTPAGADELLGLDAALEQLARLQPRQALVIESRFFGGLDVAESAELLGVSEATILRDWRAAKAWLAHQLRR